MTGPTALRSGISAASVAVLVLAALIPSSFAWPGNPPHPRQPAHQGDVPLILELGSYRAGESPAHRLTLAVSAGAPELYRVTLTYPAGFSVRGFQTTETPGAGSFAIDADMDGAPERTWPLRALTSRIAFADALEDGIYSPDLEPAVNLGDVSVDVRLPLGGDADAATFSAPGAARVSLVLAEGVIGNPTLGGRHVATAALVTVDPDSDGADDGLGAPSVRREFEVPVTIDGPRLVRFAALAVRDFDVFMRGRQADRFVLEGRFALGRRSDGIDPPNEDVTVTVGTFTQTIPGRALVRTGYGYRFKGRPPGIVALTLRRDGAFAVETRQLQWDIERRTPVRVALEIGDDTGATYAVDRHQRHFPW